jgi:hypothetical protein
VQHAPAPVADTLVAVLVAQESGLAAAGAAGHHQPGCTGGTEPADELRHAQRHRGGPRDQAGRILDKSLLQPVLLPPRRRGGRHGLGDELPSKARLDRKHRGDDHLKVDLDRSGAHRGPAGPGRRTRARTGRSPAHAWTGGLLAAGGLADLPRLGDDLDEVLRAAP